MTDHATGRRASRLAWAVSAVLVIACTAMAGVLLYSAYDAIKTAQEAANAK